jgi:peptidoglycan/LPS O-acetylase OafA/YrhL
VIIRDLPSAVGFALVIGAVASARAGRVLGGRVLAGLGAISYGFYLWHVPVLLFMRGHGLLPLDPVLGTLAALGPALAVSAVSWVALERPTIAWARRRNARERAPSRPTATAPASGGGVGGRARRREVGTVRT